jgi:uncharacterized protein (TIGR00251 family)
VTVSAGARRDEASRGPDGELRVRVAAPAIEGKANARLVRVLASWLEVPPSRVRLVRGQTSRHKMVEVEGVTRAEVDARLEGRLGSGKEPS